jgi:hypothetical protein
MDWPTCQAPLTICSAACCRLARSKTYIPRRNGGSNPVLNLLAASKILRKFAALARALTFDRRHHPRGTLEVEDGLLQLLVDNVAVAHHQDGVEDLLLMRVMQVRVEVRRPGNRFGLPRVSRVLD